MTTVAAKRGVGSWRIHSSSLFGCVEVARRRVISACEKLEAVFGIEFAPAFPWPYAIRLDLALELNRMANDIHRLDVFAYGLWYVLLKHVGLAQRRWGDMHYARVFR
eukprot:CAMPEP_0184384202 /NCGR_PEP_ID=MMETSP0007-20130409/7746_1 /TAXON_ID=97485 /ORGANISM="Prymnesium parvum, Strain Texoma1" /LENGTH=106 /DNA_ID=CAMNT_0026731001 /DNA_START=505 /DNA_END=822 /DNA_ORIENTATION=+